MARAMSPRDEAPARSPSPQPLSKRDKRRQMLSEKLNDMVSSFATNQFDHYYAQLTAIQCDINLVLRADPYRNGPLPDSPEDIARQVAEVRDEVTRRAQISDEAETNFNALSGRYYSRFVEEVNRAMEDRDAELSFLFNEHQDKLDELRRTNQYRIQLAYEEHALLSKTLRERIIQSVTQKKQKLLRDKEQLDIADSNALLLNPTQFSIGNPSSPSGVKSNRQTRHTRGRLGNDSAAAAAAAAAAAEEAPTSVPMQAESSSNGTKRKRKGEEDHSPLRGSELLAARNKPFASQFEAPLYSIDRLFTEKELALNLNRAHVATNEFFARLRAQGVENRLHAAVSSTANGSTADDDADADAGPSTPASPMPTHATRAAAQRLNPLADLAAAATTGSALLPPALNPAAMPPVYTISVPSGSSKAIPAAPSPASLPDADVSADWALMQRAPDDPVLKTLADRCLEKAGVLNLPAATAAGVLGQGPTAADGLMDAPGALPMSRAMSRGMSRGFSALGASSMSRVASEQRFGAEPMSRSVSAADFGGYARRR